MSNTTTYTLPVREISQVIRDKQLAASTSLDHNNIIKTLISVTNNGLDNNWSAKDVVEVFLDVIGEYTPDRKGDALPRMILEMQLVPLVDELAERLAHAVKGGMDMYYFDSHQDEADVFYIRVKDELQS